MSMCLLQVARVAVFLNDDDDSENFCRQITWNYPSANGVSMSRIISKLDNHPPIIDL